MASGKKKKKKKRRRHVLAELVTNRTERITRRPRTLSFFIFIFFYFRCWEKRLTVSVIAKVNELIVPLHDDSQSVFNKGDDNQESANGGQVAV